MTQDSGNNKITSFTDLKTWQKGHELVVKIYEETKSFSQEEVYGLTNQIRRAASSVTANVAEGFGRQTYQEKIQFFYTAQGSITELKDHLLVAKDVDYMTEDIFRDLAEAANETHALLQGLIKKTKSLADDLES